MKNKWILCVFMLMLCPFVRIGAVDTLTPSSRGTEAADTAPLGDVVPLDLDEVSGEILETYNFSLTKFDDVTFGQENWKGPQDASLNCTFSFTPTALYLEGEFTDDFPFCQKAIHPSKPDWWKLSYGADGIVVTLEAVDSPTQRASFALNWSAQAIRPRIDMITSLLSTRQDFARTGCVELRDGEKTSEISGGVTRSVRFRAGVPITEIAEPQFFEKPLVITVELFDLDGDYNSASVLRQTQRTARKGSTH